MNSRSERVLLIVLSVAAVFLTCLVLRLPGESLATKLVYGRF